MNKRFKLFFVAILLMCATLFVSCDLTNMSPNGGDNNDVFPSLPDDLGDLTDLKGIYDLAVKQGFDGTYEDWIEQLKGDSVEFRVHEGFIQWRYCSKSMWINLIPIKDLEGENGHDGLDGLDGENGKSAFEIFKEFYPNYIGDEKQWLDDLLNGRLSDENFKYYTVNFDDGDGNIIESTKVLSKSPVEKPKNPKKLGHIFTGWYADGVKWNFDANVVIKDLTLVANFVKANIEPNVYISYIYSDKYNIYFDIYKDNISEIEAISLYKSGELIETLDNFDKRCFENLQSNQEYVVEIVYSYDLGDDFGKQIRTVSKTITTDALSTPSVRIDNVEALFNAIKFDIYTEDLDNTCTINSVELFYNGEVLDTIFNVDNLDGLVFNNLLSEKEYVIKINYSYDLNDGTRVQQKVAEAKVITDALTLPVVTFNNGASTQSQITGEIIINDPSQVARINSIRLFNGEELVETSDYLELKFTNLTDNTKYRIEVNYSYDLNDGNGLIIKTASFEIATHPVYDLLNTEILNTSALVDDDSIFIHAEVNNPSDAIFTKVWINGREYKVDPSSNSSNIYVYIESTNGSLVTFKIDKLVASIDGNELVHYTEQNNYAEAKVYPKLSIKSIEYVDEKLNPVNDYLASDKVFIKIDLNNEVGYSLDSVEFADTYINNLTFIKDNCYLVELCSDFGYLNDQLVKYSYSLADLNKVTSINVSVKEPAYKTINNQIIEIKTVEDLMSISDGSNYYKLMSDLDLDGIEWIPTIKLTGVFDGNNHTIRNIKQARKTIDADIYGGLFKSVTGVVKDLNIEKFICMIDSEVSLYNYELSVGAISSNTQDCVIKNCHIDNNSSISIKTMTDKNSFVGGLIGCGYSTHIINSSNRANINVINSGVDIYIGGLAGYASHVDYSFNTGNITWTGNCKAHQLISCYNQVKITNCYNTGAFNGRYIEGKFESNSLYIIYNSISFGPKQANKVLKWEPKNYSFDTNGGYPLDDIFDIMLYDMPVPKKDGYYFYGWYDNKDLSGEPIKCPYYNENPVILYAKWLRKIDDYSTMIQNDYNNPFIIEDGIIKSTVHNDKNNSYISSSYQINATSPVRVYFNVDFEGDASSYEIVKYSYDNNGYTGWIPVDKHLNYIDLNPGEKLKFKINKNGDDKAHLNITQLDICLIN